MPIYVTQIKDKEGTMLPPSGETCDCIHAASHFLKLLLFFFRGWKLSRPRQKLMRKRQRERSVTVNSSISHSWITQTCSVFAFRFCFSTFKGYFGSSVISWLSLGSAFLQRPHTVLHCSGQHDNKTLAVSSNQKNLFNQEVTFDLLTETYSRRRPLPPAMDLYLWGYVKRPWVTLMMQIFFFLPLLLGDVREGAASCGWPSVCQPPPAKTVHSRWICQNVLIVVAPPTRPFAWTDSMWIQLTRLSSLQLPPRSETNQMIWVFFSFFSLFYKLWILSWWRRVIGDIRMTREHQCKKI